MLEAGGAAMIRIKRAYEPAAPGDGERVLVDRVWPRGVSRQALQIAGWERALAPSTALRRWFGHDPARWDEFVRRYREELQAPEQQARLDAQAERARQQTVTLVYGARDEEHDQAIVLRDVLAERRRAG